MVGMAMALTVIEYVLWVGIHEEIDVVSTEPIPEYVSASGVVVKVIDGAEYQVADSLNNRVVMNINGVASGRTPSAAPVIMVARDNDWCC